MTILFNRTGRRLGTPQPNRQHGHLIYSVFNTIQCHFERFLRALTTHSDCWEMLCFAHLSDIFHNTRDLLNLCKTAKTHISVTERRGLGTFYWVSSRGVLGESNAFVEMEEDTIKHV